jgi:hypothetical protein
LTQLTVAEATQAANNAEAKIPHRMTAARLTTVCRMEAKSRFTQNFPPFIYSERRICGHRDASRTDWRFVLIRKDSSGGLKEKGGSIA